jgi:hypothetical protein
MNGEIKRPQTPIRSLKWQPRVLHPSLMRRVGDVAETGLLVGALAVISRAEGEGEMNGWKWLGFLKILI